MAVGVIGKVSIEDSSPAICNTDSRQVPQGGKVVQALILQTIASTEFQTPMNASAAKDSSNIKPAGKKPAGPLLIGEAFEKSKRFAGDDTSANSTGD